MSVAADWDAIEAAVKAGLPGEVVAYLNRSFTPPAKTGSATAPASWYSLEEPAEDVTIEAADAALGEIRHDEVGVGCWVEPGCGSERLRAMVDTARHLFDALSGPGPVFVRPSRLTPPDFIDREGELWYGRVVWWQYIGQD